MAPNIKTVSSTLIVIAVVSILTMIYSYERIQQITAFNNAITTGKSPQTDKQGFHAKFSVAYWLAKNERFKEATLLFSQLTEQATAEQKSAVLHNIGNMFFLKALQVSGADASNTRDEVEYLLTQAKNSYKNALKSDHSNWGTRRNLDRVMSMLPEKPTPGVGDSENPGLIMGNIPNGLP